MLVAFLQHLCWVPTVARSLKVSWLVAGAELFSSLPANGTKNTIKTCSFKVARFLNADHRQLNPVHAFCSQVFRYAGCRWQISAPDQVRVA